MLRFQFGYVYHQCHTRSNNYRYESGGPHSWNPRFTPTPLSDRPDEITNIEEANLSFCVRELDSNGNRTNVYSKTSMLNSNFSPWGRNTTDFRRSVSSPIGRGNFDGGYAGLPVFDQNPRLFHIMLQDMLTNLTFGDTNIIYLMDAPLPEDLSNTEFTESATGIDRLTIDGTINALCAYDFNTAGGHSYEEEPADAFYAAGTVVSWVLAHRSNHGEIIIGGEDVTADSSSNVHHIIMHDLNVTESSNNMRSFSFRWSLKDLSADVSY